MNLLDANSVVSTLGLIGVLGIIFMETGLLIGLVFPGGEVVFLAGIAASGSGAAALGGCKAFNTAFVYLGTNCSHRWRRSWLLVWKKVWPAIF